MGTKTSSYFTQLVAKVVSHSFIVFTLPMLYAAPLSMNKKHWYVVSTTTTTTTTTTTAAAATTTATLSFFHWMQTKLFLVA